MTKLAPVPVAPYKHSEWKVGKLQTPIEVTLSPTTLEKIGRVIAESVEEQYPNLDVCVVNVPRYQIDATVVSKESTS